jgi:G6PDH family F420-dependent oxidoreductase
MARFGYTLMGEQSGPKQLIRDAVAAEAAGFDFLVASDHYYPWLAEQGHSPYTWAVLGAVAHATERADLMSFVTCPIRRYHPAVVAQKAATVGVLSDGRFTLGLGAGENLNEHIVGEWPQASQRHEAFTEALEIIHELLAGGTVHHSGRHFQVPAAQLWDRPEQGVPMAVAVSGPESVSLAARFGDAMVATEPSADLVRAFRDSAGDKPRYGQVPLSFGADAAACRKRAHEQFRWTGLGWPVNSQLPDPHAFASATAGVTEDQVAAAVTCGPDLDAHVEAVRKYLDAGFTDVALIQIGAEHQDEFLDFASARLLPALRDATS